MKNGTQRVRNKTRDDNIMENFKPSETDFTGAIKMQMEKFIRNCETLDSETKQKLLTELGTNFFDNRFDGSIFIEEATKWAYAQWRDQSIAFMKLWEAVVVENAKVNNKPHLVANEAITEYKKQFNLK